jgi:RNA polymerase sigma factor (sigma-70 family)
MRAGASPEPAARHAIAELYQIYWYPLYAFARRRGLDAEAAADVVQAFFVHTLDSSLLKTADQSKGRFRSYLLGALKHFLGGEWDKARAQKRGGGAVAISVDDAESRYGIEPSHALTPDRLFERQWAITLLGRVMDLIAQDYARAGKQGLFEQLKDLIAGPLPDRSYADIGATLGMTEGAVKVAVHRLRHRYREILVSQIAETVASEDEIHDEIRHLHAAIAGSL